MFGMIEKQFYEWFDEYKLIFKPFHRLALYVYEYLLHVGAQKSAQTFLSEVKSNNLHLKTNHNHRLGYILVFCSYLIVNKSDAPFNQRISEKLWDGLAIVAGWSLFDWQPVWPDLNWLVKSYWSNFIFYTSSPSYRFLINVRCHVWILAPC